MCRQKNKQMLYFYGTASYIEYIDALHTAYISCKPQLVHSILNENGMRETLEDKLLISILAGVTISQLKTLVNPSTNVIRQMQCLRALANFLEAMGVMMGLPREEALELAAQSNHLRLQGAARMALQPGAHPAQIKDALTSSHALKICAPGGK
ncbi:hypothetical protein BU17DRAFT_70951 [Hysterangium stoloniferum]|nr:hypothetical protein BU17DRAFT_70951 [Hysterangium stoloniferum]